MVTDWAFKNSEITIPLDIANNHVEYSNDSVILHSDLTVPKLNVTSLNGVIIDKFIDDLFIINHTPKIKGCITILLQSKNCFKI